MIFRPKVSTRATNEDGKTLRFYELFLAPGPQELGDTGDGSFAALFGGNWLALIDRDTDILHVYQEVDGDWVDRTDDARLPSIVGTALPSGARRLSFAFDQSARFVVAYEVGDGTVTGTRWDSTTGDYKQNIDFTGINPCLIIDSAFTFEVGGSDVIVFYQREDNPGAIYYRLQRELYATEHLLIEDASIGIFDRVQPLEWRYQLLVSDSYGEPLAPLVSERYSITWTGPDPLEASASLTGALYEHFRDVYGEEVSDELTATAALFAEYVSQRLVASEEVSDSLSGEAALVGALYTLQRMLLEYGPSEDAMTATADLIATYDEFRDVLSETEPNAITAEGALVNATYQEV